MTVTVIDDFAGANGTAISAAKWNRQYDSSTSGSIQNNKGRLRFVSTPAENYRKASLQSIAKYGRGRYRADVLLGRTGTGGQINLCSMGFCSANPYNASYTALPINGYAVEISTLTGKIVLWKIADEQARDLSGATNGGVPLVSMTQAAFVVGDVIHIEVEPSASGVAVRVWRNAVGRPSVATLSTTDTTYTNGEVKLGATGTDPGTDVHADFSAVTFDDLVTAAPTVANAGPDQAVAPSETVTLVGTPARGSNNQAGTWSQVSGPTQSLGTPVTSSTDTRVTFVAANTTSVGVACIFRYTVA